MKNPLNSVKATCPAPYTGAKPARQACVWYIVRSGFDKYACINDLRETFSTSTFMGVRKGGVIQHGPWPDAVSVVSELWTPAYSNR